MKQSRKVNTKEFSKTLIEDLLERVNKPGQYLGNEWGALHKPFDEANVRLVLSFPDTYELGMSNFGLKILYKIINREKGLMADRTYAPVSDMEALMRERKLPLWAWESRRPVSDFELAGFSLQYELTYTNVLNMLELAQIPVRAAERTKLFPLIFGGGPSAVNPEPMALFMDFFMIGDGEYSLPHAMRVVEEFKEAVGDHKFTFENELKARKRLLLALGRQVPGVYVPALYKMREGGGCPTPLNRSELLEYLEENGRGTTGDTVFQAIDKALSLTDITGGASQNGSGSNGGESSSPTDAEATGIPVRVFRQTAPLDDGNSPNGLVSYLALVHDREVLEVRRGCDRGCRFCQPGYTFLPVRERSTEDLVKMAREGLAKSGHEEYSMLSLCVSDYTSLYDTVRALNREHSENRSSLSFPSQRADRMNMDIAEELKTVRKSGITLAPEAGTERLRAVINKGLSHQQIISAIESAYASGWQSVKLYFMCCLPTEQDEDLQGIVDILQEATDKCRAIRRTDPEKYKRPIEFTCTISNFVPKPFTPFQWFGQITREETRRKHKVLQEALRKNGLNRTVTLNKTEAEISLLESVISRGGREMGEIIERAWRKGAVFDAWDERFKSDIWHEVAAEMGTTLEDIACTDREVGSEQPWDVVHIGLHRWWLVKEWEKALATKETANCTENVCHACGVCTELDTVHELAAPSPEVMKKNPFVKELAAHKDEDSHPSLFFEKPAAPPTNETLSRFRFVFSKRGDLRFIGHLDLQHLIVRAARRAGLKLAYTQGFNPSPKLALAGPLPIYFESEGEVGEVELAEAIDAQEFQNRMNGQLPKEVQLDRVISLTKKPENSLSASLESASYRAVLAAPNGDGKTIDAKTLAEKVEALLNQESILVDTSERKQKKQRSSGPSHRDIRSGIKSLSVVSNGALPVVLEMELSCSPQLHVKPLEVLECIDKDLRFRLTRLQLKAANGSLLLEHDLPGATAPGAIEVFSNSN